MSTDRVERNKATVLKYLEATNANDMGLMDELLIPDFTGHGPALVPFFRGRDVMKGGVSSFKETFPDATLTAEELFGEGDKVMAHIIVTATHVNEWMGAAPTGKKLTWTSTMIARFNEDGLMAERWVIEDFLGLMQQAGVMPKSS